MYQVDASGGNISDYHISMSAVDGTDPGVKLGVYEAPSSGNAMTGESLVEGETHDVAAQNDNTWASAGGSALSANGWYAITWVPESSNNKAKYDTDAGARGSYGNSTYANEFLDPGQAGWNNANTWKWSQWVDYSAAGGSNMPLGPLTGIFGGPFAGPFG